MVPPGVPERKLVPVPEGRRGEGGILAKTLQWGDAPQCSGQPAPQGIRRIGAKRGLNRKTRTVLVQKMGPDQAQEGNLGGRR